MSEHRNILDYDTVALLEDEAAVEIIDETVLPKEVKLVKLRNAEEVWEAIKLLRVRGAPAIGCCAAFGLYVSMANSGIKELDKFKDEFVKTRDYLNTSRPTAVNLPWALNRMSDKAHEYWKNGDATVEGTLDILHDEAVAIYEEDVEMCRRIGENGLTLLKPGYGILTHCNAGQLATSKYGTVTAPMYFGFERGYNFRIYADETRPLLQGARLTAYELYSAGLDVTLQCDNMASILLNPQLIIYSAALGTAALVVRIVSRFFGNGCGRA